MNPVKHRVFYFKNIFIILINILFFRLSLKNKSQLNTHTMTKQVLTTRLITNYDIIVSVTLINRTEKTAFVMIEKGEIVRCKIRTGYNGKQYVMPYGTYSMAPMFDLN